MKNSNMAEPVVSQSACAEAEPIEEFLAREYLPVIRQFPEGEVQKSLLQESVVTLVRVKDPSKKPPSAPVLERLPPELRICLAFCGEGVKVPGTSHKLRHSAMSLFTFLELARGDELMLPGEWRQYVRSETWIGKKLCLQAWTSRYTQMRGMVTQKLSASPGPIWHPRANGDRA